MWMIHFHYSPLYLRYTNLMRHLQVTTWIYSNGWILQTLYGCKEQKPLASLHWNQLLLPASYWKQVVNWLKAVHPEAFADIPCWIGISCPTLSRWNGTFEKSLRQSRSTANLTARRRLGLQCCNPWWNKTRSVKKKRKRDTKGQKHRRKTAFYDWKMKIN